MVMTVCQKQLDVVKTGISWQLLIEDLMESLNSENSFFFENKDIYMAEIIKYMPQPILAKRSTIFKEDPAAMYKELHHAKQELQPTGEIIISSDDEELTLVKPTPKFKVDADEEMKQTK